jgi:DNA-binding transcriptional ArsR family regulator
MQPFSCLTDIMEAVFKALAHKSRRQLLDRLFARGGQSLGALGAAMPMSRQAVAKHLVILEAANLVSIHWQGREKLHFLNPVPIGDIVRRWVGKFEDARVESLTGLKAEVEAKERKNVRS